MTRNATVLADLGADTYPWWSLVEASGRHVRCTHRDPDLQTYEIFVLAPEKIHAAMDRASGTGMLCCPDMALDYSDGCANDADVILQLACFDTILFG